MLIVVVVMRVVSSEWLLFVFARKDYKRLQVQSEHHLILCCWTDNKM